ncbi:hypothetical protein Pelo_16941 [Pelomyxa schiedti]|nr:hypothetical protein Pelo_16941 [Pelomyxa schiedti]
MRPLFVVTERTVLATKEKQVALVRVYDREFLDRPASSRVLQRLQRIGLIPPSPSSSRTAAPETATSTSTSAAASVVPASALVVATTSTVLVRMETTARRNCPDVEHVLSWSQGIIVLREVKPHLVIEVCAKLPYALPFAEAVEKKCGCSELHLQSHIGDAINAGNIPFVRYALEKEPVYEVPFILRKYCFVACRTGCLELTQLLLQKLPSLVTDNNHCGNMFMEACLNGHMAVASWLRETACISVASLHSSDPDNTILSRVCAGGHVKTAKWLVGELGLTIPDYQLSSTMQQAISEWNLELVKWLIDTFPSVDVAWAEKYLAQCCYTSDVDSFDWLLKKMPTLGESSLNVTGILSALAESNSVEMAQHVFKSLKNWRPPEPVLSSNSFGCICSKGNIELAEWFHSKFPQHDSEHHLNCLYRCLHSGNVAACKWILKTFNIPEPFEVLSTEIVRACSKHHVELVHWFSTFPSFQELVPSERCSVFAAAASTWDLEFTKWTAGQLWSNSVTLSSSLFWTEATITAFSGKPELLDWILQHFPNLCSQLSEQHPTTPEGNALVQKILLQCCEKCDLEGAKSLAKLFSLTPGDMRFNGNLPLATCCTSGFVKGAQWLLDDYLQLSDLDAVNDHGNGAKGVKLSFTENIVFVVS